MAGRPKGAENKDKPFAEALRMELAAAGADGKKLRKIAKALIDKAELGEGWAIQQVGDRLDGRPAQAIEHNGEIQHRYVADVPTVADTTEQWQQQHVRTIQ